MTEPRRLFHRMNNQSFSPRIKFHAKFGACVQQFAIMCGVISLTSESRKRMPRVVQKNGAHINVRRESINAQLIRLLLFFGRCEYEKHSSEHS